MLSKRPVSNKRRQRSGGTTIVEMALTYVPLIAMIVGIFDVSMMVFRWTTLQNAVREGARYAITFQTSGGGQDASIKAVVQNNAIGFVRTTDSPATIFVNYYAPTALNTAITCDTHTAGCVATGGNVPGNIVEVSTRVPFSWFAPLTGSTKGTPFYTSGSLTINSYSSDVLGGYPVGITSVAR
jgi:Flp pilus assembly protein TadG